MCECVQTDVVMLKVERTWSEHQSFYSDASLKIENNAQLLSVQVKNNDINYGKMAV